MCYDIEREAFLKKLEIFIRNEGKVSDSVIKIYLRKIRRLLYSEYSVGDLCGVVDQLMKFLQFSIGIIRHIKQEILMFQSWQECVN